MGASHTLQKSGMGSACVSIDIALRQAFNVTILTQVWVRESGVTPHLTAACPLRVLPSSAFVADFLDPAGL